MSNSPDSVIKLGASFAKEYHEHVRAHWSDEQLPARTSRLVFSDDGYHTETPGDIAWHAVVFDVVSRAWETELAEGLCRALREIGLPRRIVDSSSVDWHQLREFILREALAPVVTTYEAIGSLQFDEEIANSEWERWNAHWTAESETKVLYVLLDQLRLAEPAAIELALGITLEPMTTALRQELWREAHATFGILPLEEFSRPSAVIRVQGPAKPPNSGLEPELTMAGMAVTALRLAVPGHFWPLGPIRTVLPPVIEAPIALLHYKGQAPNLFSTKRGRPTQVDPAAGEATVEALRELYEVTGAPGKAGLELPLRRFEQSFSREVIEDVLVDLAIVLESTLLADIPNDELKYRTSLRGAALLASQVPAADSMALLRKLYDARSVVVHRGVTLADVAGRGSFKWLLVDEFVPAAENLVRLILRALLHRCASGDTIHEVVRSLEASIIAGLAK